MNSERLRHLTAVGALSFASLIWAGNAIVGHFISDRCDPLTLSFFRWLLTTLALGFLCWREILDDLPRYAAHRGFLLFGGIIGMASFHVLQYKALSETSAINVTLIICATPAIVALLSIMFGQRLPSLISLFGILLSMFGAIVVVVHGSFFYVENFKFKSGEFFMLTAVVCWAVYSIMLRWRPVVLSGTSMLFAMSFVATLVLLPFYSWAIYNGLSFSFTIVNIGIVLYVGFAASLIAYLAYSFGVEQTGPVVGAQFLCLIPLFTATMTGVTTREPITFYQLIALPCVIGGVLLSNIFRQEARPVQPYSKSYTSRHVSGHSSQLTKGDE